MDAILEGNRVAERLGIVKPFEATKIRETRDSINQPLSYQFVYEQSPHGYKGYKGDGCILFVIDPLDGRITEYRDDSQTGEVISWTANLKEGQAVLIADKVAKKNGLNDPPYTWSSREKVKPNELVYVFHNKCFGSSIETGPKIKYHLAWVIHYPYGDSVWIDAGTGKVLGGEYTARKGHPSFGEGIDN